MIVELENKWEIVCQQINPRNGLITYKRYVERADTLIEACMLHSSECIIKANFSIEEESK